MAPSPWASAPSHEQLFVLITGANSGVGLGIGERLIDEFLAQRSLSSHLILIPTTRSVRKSRETIAYLQAHVEKAAQSSSLRKRAGPSYDWRDTVARVHILSIQLDLCDLPGVYAVADRLVYGTVSNPPDLPLQNVSIPRLDSVIFNAGFGGWIGLDWPALGRMLFRDGIVQTCTWPDFKLARPGAVLAQRPVRSDLVPDPPSPIASGSAHDTKPSTPVLGEVFCANVFGHYLFAHALLPLLCRASEAEPPGRIIWTSSVEPTWRSFSVGDLQGIATRGPYESSKRLTDVLGLTCELPSVKRFSDSFFRMEDGEFAKRRPIRPKVYVSHPGVVASTLFPLSWVLFYLYKLSLFISRWIGSAWHCVDGYRGACAPTWMALQDQATLDAAHAERIKWGSSCTRFGFEEVKKTEVDWWGWEGKVEDREALRNDPAAGVQRKLAGRNRFAVSVTKESIEDFEALGAECWAEMERLRHQWEEILGVKAGRKVEQ